MYETCTTVKVKADNSFGFAIVNHSDLINFDYELYVDVVVSEPVLIDDPKVKVKKLT